MQTAMPPFWASWLYRPVELRIDVSPIPPQQLEGECASIHDRINTPGDRLYGIPEIPLSDPRFAIRYRAADGEFYVYVEDLQEHRIAGFIVFSRLIELDKQGYIPADAEMRTSLPGVFSAGDVNQKTYRQITTAMADGTIALLNAERYLRTLKK